MRGPMRAAFERGAVEPGARQHAARDRHMRGLAAMAGAGQRQFLVAEAERSAAPLSTSGSACIAFTAERG